MSIAHSYSDGIISFPNSSIILCKDDYFKVVNADYGQTTLGFCYIAKNVFTVCIFDDSTAILFTVEEFSSLAKYFEPKPKSVQLDDVFKAQNRIRFSGVLITSINSEECFLTNQDLAKIMYAPTQELHTRGIQLTHGKIFVDCGIHICNIVLSFASFNRLIKFIKDNDLC